MKPPGARRGEPQPWRTEGSTIAFTMRKKRASAETSGFVARLLPVRGAPDVTRLVDGVDADTIAGEKPDPDKAVEILKLMLG